MEPYDVALIQTRTRVVRNLSERDEVVESNIRRIGELIGFAANRMGEIKLAVTGEYSLFGQFRPRSVDEWIQIADTIPNRFTDRLGEVAQASGVYLGAHALETIPRWPGRYFNTGLIISPSGDIIFKYHKHNGPNNLNTSYTGPADIYDEYVDEYGSDQLFPVVDTPIGRLGMFICGDLQYPEVARCVALKGAEVLLHPTADIYRRAQDGWEAMRRARAAENGCYVLSCTTGAFMGTDRPVDGYRGRSQVFGPDGMTLACADGPGEVVVTCSIDVDRLRWRRSKIGQTGHVYNQGVLIRSDLYGEEYRKAGRWPNNAFLKEPLTSTDASRSLAREIIDRLVREGRQILPDAGADADA